MPNALTLPRQAILPFALLGVMLAVSPAGACDPEDLWAEMRATCVDFVTAASQMALPVHARLNSAEKDELGRLTTAALKGCEGPSFGAAAQETARLGVLIGRLEARHGLTTAAN
ncbi:hypothetical protein [Phreatobacter sp.]|uniref:hypothetical protein n=1 Tax=Phreatobacter sp. TaxID=1966341 RepID=UPI0025EA7B03|nr:hypothetical protein [Phreatobacter sp.]